VRVSTQGRSGAPRDARQGAEFTIAVEHVPLIAELLQRGTATLAAHESMREQLAIERGEIEKSRASWRAL
jgi:hypothetical protein